MAVHEARIVDFLDKCEKVAYSGSVYRVTGPKTDPLAPSLRGGRWMPPNTTAVLYTSCDRDGAIAEVAHNYSQFEPPPKSQVRVHEISVVTRKTAVISVSSLKLLGLTRANLEGHLAVTQRIGAAAAFLEYDGILVPSLRWATDNLVVFSDLHGFDAELSAIKSEEDNWVSWKVRHSTS